MAQDFNLIGGSNTAGKQNVDADFQALVTTTKDSTKPGYVSALNEVDGGAALGTAYNLAIEVDDDYRARVGSDIILEEEDFTYNVQNFTKHAMFATTYAPTWTVTGFNTNPTYSLTAGAAMVLKTYKTFSMEGTETLSYDVEGSFTYQSGVSIPANTVIEFGFGLTANTTPYDCFDGTYFRATPSGVYGVIRNNSNSDTAVSSAFNGFDGLPWMPVSGRKYQLITYLNPRECKFWVADPLLDEIWMAAMMPTPVGYGAPIASQATQIFHRQYQASAPSVGSYFTLSRSNVRRGGGIIATGLGESVTRHSDNIYSQGTLTTTLNQTITTGSITRPAAAVPSNTTVTLSSLGGIYVETGTLALGTDAILLSYGVPALPVAVATTYIPNRRLRVNGVGVTSGVTTAFATGGFTKFFYLAYGSTSASLAGVTADTVTTKAFRRVMLPIVQYYTATHAIGATNNSAMTYFELPRDDPIYVNPGEFVDLCTFHQGTVGTVGVITHALQLFTSWE